MKPRHFAIAESLIGVKEVPGPNDSPIVMAWAKEAREGVDWLRAPYRGDADPWCGLFVAICLKRAGLARQKGIVGLRASSWAGYGDDIGIGGFDIELGAIAVFSRQGGGHVGFVSGIYRNGDLEILSGNVGDTVKSLRFTRDRLTAVRWPAGLPFGPPAPRLIGAGVISRNEA